MLTREYWMIYKEDQAFSPWYDLAPPPPLSLHSCQLVVSLSHSSWVLLVQLADGRGGRGDGGRAKSYDCEKAWSSIYHSVLSVANSCQVRSSLFRVKEIHRLHPRQKESLKIFRIFTLKQMVKNSILKMSGSLTSYEAKSRVNYWDLLQCTNSNYILSAF